MEQSIPTLSTRGIETGVERRVAADEHPADASQYDFFLEGLENMNMPPYPVTTAATTVAIAVLQTGLMLYVGLGRTQTATGLGDGGDEGLRRRIRMHGNLAENSALFLVLLFLLELTGDWTRAVPSIGAAFVLARLAHPIGLYRTSGASVLRLIGVSGTALAFLVAAGMLGISVVTGLGTHG